MDSTHSFGAYRAWNEPVLAISAEKNQPRNGEKPDDGLYDAVYADYANCVRFYVPDKRWDLHDYVRWYFVYPNGDFKPYLCTEKSACACDGEETVYRRSKEENTKKIKELKDAADK